MSVQLGEITPNFKLQASNGEWVELTDFRGKNVVLYFYPKDMTPGCTTQACEFRAYHDEFTSLNAVILGVSPDPIARHEKFIEKYGLPYLLLADINQEAAKAYDVWKLKKNFGKEYMGIERSTFIIDKDGKLIKEYRKVKVAGHVEDALEYLKSL